MKNKLLVVFIFLILTKWGQAADSKYYFGDANFDPKITTPEDFFGFEIGTSLVRYDKVVEYFKLLAQQSDRASYQIFGHSWQHREQIKLFVTSPSNQQNLEAIRQEHLKLIDPSASADLSNQKLIVEFAYNVHGGEISGTDASVLAAYYLVASIDSDITKRLDESVVLFEPAQNPDGRERSASHINSFHTFAPVADPADIGHGSSISPHRGNHFWNDLNRDWLPLSQIESKNRVAFYHQWYPNVFLDFHEMGSESTYYFEPSPLSTWNKIIPPSNYEVLNDILARSFASALDAIGSLYFTKESFTNLSPIYGSTYPDYQGGVGVTLEVGSTSGVQIQTAAGIRTFAKNLKDNFLVGIAGFRAATDNKEVFLNYQKDFFKSALTHADKLANKTIVFGSSTDKSLNNLFLEHLLSHNIEVFELQNAVSHQGQQFEPGSAYVASLRQPQFRILQSIFEENETNDFDEHTTFYDISAWSTAHGYGVPFAKLSSAVKTGTQITQTNPLAGRVTGRSNLAYVFEFNDYLAPKALYFLQNLGIQTRVSQKEFTTKIGSGEKRFSPGSIVIPVGYQQLSSDQLYQSLQEAARLSNIEIVALTDGFSVAGVDLGSNNIRVLQKPEVAIVAEGNWTNLGEVWNLLSNTHGIPVTKLTSQAAENANLNQYTTIILQAAPGSAALREQISQWVRSGGTLITQGPAAQWASSTFVERSTNAENNASAPGTNSGTRLFGIIVEAELNTDHPLSYGVQSSEFQSLINNTRGLQGINAPDQILVKTTNGKLINGYVTSENLEQTRDQVVIGTLNPGRGTVVLFAEAPVFRGYWFSTGRFLSNAVFFGQTLARGGRR